MLDRNRRLRLQAEYNNWYFQPATAGCWEDFVDEISESDLEIGYLQGLKDRDQHKFADGNEPTTTRDREAPAQSDREARIQAVIRKFRIYGTPGIELRELLDACRELAESELATIGVHSKDNGR